MREMSQSKETTRPTPEPYLPVIAPLATTIDSHQASTSFTFQAPIPDSTITVSPTFPNNDLSISYHSVVSNTEFHPSIPIPSVYPTTNFPTRGMAYVARGEIKEKEN